MANLELKNLSKNYGAVRVIENLNLQIEDGAFTVFVGPSGCGKSTLLRLIAGLETIDGGQLAIDGTVVNTADPIERGVAMVFQNYALYPHMSVEDNIGFALKMAGMGKDAVSRQVHEAARALRIEPLLKRRPAQLSGGQRQRVAIGRAIVRNPAVFLFDEPLSNLDAELRVSMRIEIAKLHQRLGTTMIYVTHDQTEAMTLADKIVVLRAGKIEQEGSPDELYKNPINTFVAGFIGSPRMNFINAVSDGTGLRIDAETSWKTSLPMHGDVVIGVRPEHFVAATPGLPTIQMRVDVVENLGGTRYLYGAISSGAEIIVEARDLEHIKAGDTVSLSVPVDRMLFFSADGKRI